MVAITVVIPVPTAAFFDREVAPAAVIHPNAPVIRAPTVAFGAGRFAMLIHQLGSARPIRRTIVPLAVVRRTRNGLSCAAWNEHRERAYDQPQVIQFFVLNIASLLRSLVLD